MLLCHNPYFSRWFSAIHCRETHEDKEWGHNPYFSRWFSAIIKTVTRILTDHNVTILILVDGFLQLVLMLLITFLGKGHNPYFSRWFSAMKLQNLKSV